MNCLKPLEQIQITQKRVKYAPSEKLTDALIAILSGARGMLEVNTRVRSAEALQRAFGRQMEITQHVNQESGQLRQLHCRLAMHRFTESAI